MTAFAMLTDSIKLAFRMLACTYVCTRNKGRITRPNRSVAIPRDTYAGWLLALLKTDGGSYLTRGGGYVCSPPVSLLFAGPPKEAADVVRSEPNA